ncbi:Uncharacterized protein SCF082_LOCUS30083 [Durusdinium trenchii]|uniref:Photolyase/cryptochrome alpha/beta domain-containing protein n=1 Tax=Durusdinium trenchii TaxID=1381693 RepID=A0ABP0N075_9DINO
MGSAEVVIWEAGRNTGDGSASSFLVFLLVTWVAAGLVGAFLCWCCCLRATPRTVSGDQEAVLAWERLTAKALRFIARRRRLGVAFHSLRDYSLRNNTGSRPTTARRALHYQMVDPTEDELRGINNLDDAQAWSGVDGVLARTLNAALGDPARVREIALIPRPIWDDAVDNLEIQEGGDPAPAPRPLTPVENARVESLRRVCCIRSGRLADHRGDTGRPAAPAGMPAPFPPAGGGGAAAAPGVPAPQARKLKLSAVLDPTLDAEIQALADAEVTAMYDRYKNRFGDFPSTDADVSRDQLAALSQVIASGSVPFADFSIFGPHGQRLLRRQTFQSYTLNVSTGEWGRKEQPGPASFYDWYKAWRCYRTAMLLLEASEAERLDAYAEHIRGAAPALADPKLTENRKGWKSTEPEQKKGEDGERWVRAETSGGAQGTPDQVRELVSTVGQTSTKPRALIVLCGRSREGDLAHQLARLGWLVCCLDTVTPRPTNLLDDKVWDLLKDDIDKGMFEAAWIATPCGTFSPLREKPPGPRVLRTVEHITGVANTTKAEAAQLRDANILVHRSYKVADRMHQQKKPWGLENPDHPQGKPSLWLMPRIKDIPNWTHRLDITRLQGKRCFHPKRTFARPDGAKIQAARMSTVQRTENVDGKTQWASKAQGEYTTLFSKVLAVAIHKTARTDWKKEELQREPL